MREDFDYVTMANYEKDTAELIAISNAQLEAKNKEIQELKMLLFGAVKTMGKIHIDKNCLLFIDDYEFIRHDRPDLNHIVFTTNPDPLLVKVREFVHKAATWDGGRETASKFAFEALALIDAKMGGDAQ